MVCLQLLVLICSLHYCSNTTPYTQILMQTHINFRCKQQQDATIFAYWSFFDLFESAVHVSGDKLAHLQEHFFDCIYSFLYNAPILLPTGDNFATGRQQYRCIVPKLYIRTVKKVLLKMGEFVVRNMKSWFKKINKRDLLHLVGCLYRCSNHARSHESQIHIN